MSTNAMEPLVAERPASLKSLATGLNGKAHLLSIGDEELAKLALAAAKDVFDHGEFYRQRI
jgi:U3 small nucleolar RNA-associated protein MPP10